MNIDEMKKNFRGQTRFVVEEQIVDSNDYIGDLYIDSFDSLDEALNYAKDIFHRLTKQKQLETNILVYQSDYDDLPTEAFIDDFEEPCWNLADYTKTFLEIIRGIEK